MPLNNSNWKTQICLAVLRRADFSCEDCKKEGYSIVYETNYHNITKWWETMEEAEFECRKNNINTAPKPVKVTLTITHMDEPDNSSVLLDHLRAWCQMCRLKHNEIRKIEDFTSLHSYERRVKKIHKPAVQALA